MDRLPTIQPHGPDLLTPLVCRDLFRRPFRIKFSDFARRATLRSNYKRRVKVQGMCFITII